MWILYALGSAFFASLVAILGKVGLKDIDSTLATTVRSVIMATFLVLVALSFKKFNGVTLNSFGTREWVFVALSGIAGAMSWLCYFYALKYGNTTTVSALDRLSVVFVAILAATFLGESMNLYKIIGVVLVALGAFMTILK